MTTNENQDNFIVRKIDKKTRFYCDNEFMEKGYMGFFKRISLIYFVLTKYANAKKQFCFPKYETIMKQSGIKSKNVVAHTINAFEFLRLIGIKRSRGRKSNYYYLLDSSQWKPLNSINIDTVKRVLKMNTKQYQNLKNKSITSDTGNHINISHINKSTKDVALNKLIEIGIANNKTEELLENYNLDRINHALEEMDKNKSKIRNKAGWILQALEHNWEFKKNFYTCEYGYKHSCKEECGHKEEAKWKEVWKPP